MAFKEFPLDEGGNVKIYKHRAARSLRLSVAPSGDVRVTIPAWAPYSAGLTFAKKRLDWIREQQPARQQLLTEGLLIGKAHRLCFVSTAAT
jgi:predicted metal-dependent hydrolase